MKNPILRSMLWSAACLLLTVSASSAKSPERTSGYVGIRPLPRSAGESKIDWMSGIGYYDSLLRPDDFTAKYTDVIKDYRGAFATRKCFFEHYLPLDRDWIDMNPETNPLILKIRSREKIGMEVEHILICREAELLGRGKWGPFKEDSRRLPETVQAGLQAGTDQTQELQADPDGYACLRVHGDPRSRENR